MKHFLLLKCVIASTVALLICFLCIFVVLNYTNNISFAFVKLHDDFSAPTPTVLPTATPSPSPVPSVTNTPMPTKPHSSGNTKKELLAKLEQLKKQQEERNEYEQYLETVKRKSEISYILKNGATELTKESGINFFVSPSVKPGGVARLSVKLKPNEEYSIYVSHATNERNESELSDKRSGTRGDVTWMWHIREDLLYKGDGRIVVVEKSTGDVYLTTLVIE